MAKKNTSAPTDPDGQVWVNSQVGCPPIDGNVEISQSEEGVFIAGDPAGFRSLARILDWIANVDQESIPSQPEGERYHVHLYPRRQNYGSLTPSSAPTELCRFDAKGTGGPQ